MLTICLVTKGRLKHMDAALESLNAALKYDFVKVIIFDNGSYSVSSEKLAKWSLNRAEKVKYLRNEINDPRQYWYIDYLRNQDVGWVVFPGDDDILQMAGIEEWKKLIDESQDLEAICFSALSIDDLGKSENKILTPAIFHHQGKLKILAQSLHEPPFIWPCLFFDVSKIDFSVPSRYVFDWCVGLNIVVNNNFILSDKIGLKYRSHPSQESNLAPLRQKVFEATFWITEFLTSHTFQKMVMNLSVEEKIRLWTYANQVSPIYGNSEFSRPVIFALKSTLLGGEYNSRLSAIIATDLAIDLNTIFPEQRALNFTKLPISTNEQFHSNFDLKLEIGVCEPIQRMSLFFSSLGSGISANIGCLHSHKSRKSLRIDCKALIGRDQGEVIDLFITQLSQIAEIRGDFSMTITSSEKWVIRFLRKLKTHLPSWMLMYVSGWKNRIHNYD